MSTKQTFASFLASEGATSVELTKLVLDPPEVKVYVEGFKRLVDPASANTSAFIKLFHRSTKGDGTRDVKIKTFDLIAQDGKPSDGKSSMVNERIRQYSTDVGTAHVVVKKSIITPIKQVPQTAERLEIVRRTAFQISNAEWQLQIDLVKAITNPAEFASKLPTAKTHLINTSLDEMEASAYDYVRTSLLYLSTDASPSSRSVRDIVDDVVASSSSTGGDIQQYQSEIFTLAGDIFRDPMIVSQFKQQAGFKRLCANTVELSRPIYFKQVLPVIDTFYVTDKMDGVRAMLVINEVFRRRRNHKRLFLGVEIKAIADRVYTISDVKHATGSSIKVDRTVLDVEMITDVNGKHSFYCFDVIVAASRRMSNSPFKDRFRKFSLVNALLLKYDLGTVKEFIHLTQENFGAEIQAFYEKKRSYHIDGLIFTPQGIHFKEAIAGKKKFQRVFNTDYSSTISFKWKPLNQMTIDFYMMANPLKKGSYILCSGIDARTFEQLRMSFFDGYEAPQSPNAHKYFPIQFSASDGSFNPVWSPTKHEITMVDSSSECPLAGLVGEFAFATDDYTRLHRPTLVRVRLDRVHDVALGQYYGNALRYSELIWHSIQHPLTLETLCGSINENSASYFAADDADDWYKAQRNFNSFVKTHLLTTFLFATVSGKSRIMDIAAGKGQDLARAVDVGYDEIVALDRDVDALYEMLDRKYNLRVNRKGATATIHVKPIDLENSAQTTIANLKIAGDTADSIMINFALHYICHNASPGKSDPLTEFAKLCSFYLKTGGRVMITAFTGDDIFKLLDGRLPTQSGQLTRTSGTPMWSVKENNRLKYAIKRMYSSDTLTPTDQAIEVLLPFSAGEYYREFLVNYEHVEHVFNQEGFTLVTSDSFGSLLRNYKKQNPRGFATLSDVDREYVSLYGFQIYEKTTTAKSEDK